MKGEPLRPVPKPGNDDRRRARQRGKAAEKRVADKLGGRRTAFSGAGTVEKGDVHVDDLGLFLEVKYLGIRQGRGADSITIERSWLEKTLLDAKAANMLPVVGIQFAGGGGAYICSSEDFEKLVKQVREARQ